MFNIKKIFDNSYKNSLSLHDNDKKEFKSIVFISFHKCATSFFSKYILKESKNYKHIDYLGNMYNSNLIYYPYIKEYGYIYGVIRIQDENHPRYKFVEGFFKNKKFKQLKHIFWIRDPRDILVSMYYSFGFTHAYSEVNDIREYQIKRRKINDLTIDDYVLKEVYNIKKKFNRINELIIISDEYIILKYEDMINNFDKFYNDLDKIVYLNKAFYNYMKIETRPHEKIDIKGHKRSGKVGSYKNELLPETIIEINKILHDILISFNYSKN